MNETTPKYAIELKNSLDELKGHMDKRFDSVEEKIEKEVGDLAIMTAKQFLRIDSKFESADIRFGDLEDKITNIEHTMATKDDADKILKHIGAYEIRAKNIEKILLKDHKPKITALEKEVFA